MCRSNAGRYEGYPRSAFRKNPLLHAFVVNFKKCTFIFTSSSPQMSTHTPESTVVQCNNKHASSVYTFSIHFSWLGCGRAFVNTLCNKWKRVKTANISFILAPVSNCCTSRTVAQTYTYNTVFVRNNCKTRAFIFAATESVTGEITNIDGDHRKNYI